MQNSQAKAQAQNQQEIHQELKPVEQYQEIEQLSPQIRQGEQGLP